MDLEFSGADIDFRREARAWLRDNTPRQRRPSSGPEIRVFDTEWQRKLHSAGWAGISWPAEFGGRGLGFTQQLIWFEEYALAGAPEVGCNFVGVNHAGPTLTRAPPRPSAPATCPPYCVATRSGAKDSASPAPARTWRRSGRGG